MISAPRGLRTFRDRLSLLALVSLKWPEEFMLGSMPGGVPAAPPPRPNSLKGHSTFITSAPSAPSHRVAQGPARTQVKSTIRMPSRGLGWVFSSVAWG